MLLLGHSTLSASTAMEYFSPHVMSVSVILRIHIREASTAFQIRAMRTRISYSAHILQPLSTRAPLIKEAAKEIRRVLLQDTVPTTVAVQTTILLVSRLVCPSINVPQTMAGAHHRDLAFTLDPEQACAFVCQDIFRQIIL
jgi:hypothetical protein